MHQPITTSNPKPDHAPALLELQSLTKDACAFMGYESPCELREGAVWIEGDLNVTLRDYGDGKLIFHFRAALIEKGGSIPWTNEAEKRRAVFYAVIQWQQGKLEAWKGKREETRISAIEGKTANVAGGV